MEIRKATIEDYEHLTHVHISSRISTYKDMISAERLEYEKGDEFLHKTLRMRKEFLESWQIVYVAEIEEKIVWFVYWWKQRESDFDVEWELYSIYIIQEYWRKWIWKLLFARIRKDFKDVWYKAFCLWALSWNESADRFYKKMWWVLAWEKKQEKRGVEYHYVWYVFNT